MQYDAIILAGGQGSRLGGVDKARLLLAGTELVRRPLAAVRDAARVVVVGPPSLADHGVLPEGVLLTREDPPGGGPAAGTAAGLNLLARTDVAPWVVLLSCDLPLADAGLPHLLTAAQRSSTAPPADAPARSSTAAKHREDTTETPPVPDTTRRSSTAAKQRGDVAGQECPRPTAPLTEPPDGYCLTGPDGHLQWLFAIYRTSALLRAVRDCPEPAGTSMRRLLAPLTLVAIPGTADVSADLDTWDDHATWTERLREDT